MDAAKSLIFAERAVAVAIMDTLKARHPGATWSVKQVPLGFQIVKTGGSKGLSFVKAAEAQSAFDAMSDKLGLAAAVKSPELKAEIGKPVAAPKMHKNSALDQPCLVILPYIKMTPEYLLVKNGAKTAWIQKSSVGKFQLTEVVGEEVMIEIKMPLWYAMKRHFPYNAI